MQYSIVNLYAKISSLIRFKHRRNIATTIKTTASNTTQNSLDYTKTNTETEEKALPTNDEFTRKAILGNNNPYFQFSEKSFSELQSEIVVLRSLLIRQKSLLNSLKNDEPTE